MKALEFAFLGGAILALAAGTAASAAAARTGSARLVAWVRAFLEQLYVRTGVRGMVYVSPSFWSTKMGNSV